MTPAVPPGPASGSTSGSVPADLLRAAVAADASRPFVTFYDDATGERVELSVATLDNWVAKTANLLVDGLAAEPGERLLVTLPAHWQTQVWLLAGWAAGLLVTPVDPAAAATVAGDRAGDQVADRDGDRVDPAAADVVVTGPEGLDWARGCRGSRVAVSLRPLGLPFAQAPDGFEDYTAEVLGYGDRFVPVAPAAGTAPALELGGQLRSGAELVAAAHRAAAAHPEIAGARLLTAEPLTSWPGLLAGLLVPLATGGSVVLCRHLDPAAVPDRAAAEHVTHVVGETLLSGLSDSS